MFRFSLLLTLAVVALLAACSQNAEAQFRIRLGGGHHDDHHDDHHDGHHDIHLGGRHGIHVDTHHDTHHEDVHVRHGNHFTPGYHIDHHDHIVRDSHGHVIGNYHHDVIHADSTYIVPHVLHTPHLGTYYHRNNQYYYTPSNRFAYDRFEASSGCLW